MTAVSSLRKTLVALALNVLFFCPSLFSQTNFTGFAVTNTNDTVHGHFTNYRNWEKSPAAVGFLSANGQKLILTPENTKEFTVDGYDTYASFQVTRMTNPTILQGGQEVGNDRERFEDVRAFLRKAGEAQGVSIWLYNDAKRKNFFYQQKDSALKELLFWAFVEDGKYVEKEPYKRQLFALFQQKQEPAKLTALINKLSYADESFQQFLDELNQTVRVKQKNKRNGFYVFAGISRNSFRLKYESLYADNSFTASLNPVAGLAYFLTSNRNFGRLFFSPQLRLYNFTNAGQNKLAGANATYKSGLVFSPSLNIGCFILNSSDAARLFVSGGGSALVMPSNKVIREQGSGFTEEKENSFVYAFNAQLGCIVKTKFFVSGYFSLPVSVTTRVYYSGYHSSLQFAVGYKL